MNAQRFAAAVAPSPSLATLAGAAPLTRVTLIHLEQGLQLSLRFGEPVRVVRLNRWRRLALFAPGAVFGRLLHANDRGTVCWQLTVMQACTSLDAVQRIAGVLPGARRLLHADGEPAVRAVLERIDAIEALGIATADVAPTYWRMLGNRLATRLPLPAYTAERHAIWQTGRTLR